MSAWDSIFKLENTSIAIKEDVERNEAIGLLSMYLAMKCPPNYDFKKFEQITLQIQKDYYPELESMYLEMLKFEAEDDNK